jgi:shikimate dehydrogenase
VKITHETRLNMVIGYPLTHSQSPFLHQTIYKELEIDKVLLAQPHRSLKAVIQTIKTLSIELTAVTLPYKEQVIQYLDVCSSEVQVLKAANTIIQREGKLYGYNTDIEGIAFALRKVTVKNKKVLVIGAGGAARAIGYFLKKHHAYIFWLNRTKEKAVILANEFGNEVIVQDDYIKQSFDIVINTTSIGLYPDVHKSPLPCMTFHDKQVVFDMIYNPMKTAFLKQAEKNRATVISGLDMFIGQGLKQIELLTSKMYPLDRINSLRKLLICNQ